MPLYQASKCVSDPELGSWCPPRRPSFHQRYTNDRIREGLGRPPSFSMTGKIRKDRKSVFRELGLDTDEPVGAYATEHEFGALTGLGPKCIGRAPSKRQRHDRETVDRTSRAVSDGEEDQEGHRDKSTSPRPPPPPPTPTTQQKPWYSRLAPGRRPRIKTVSSAPPPSMSSFTRFSTIVLLIAVVLPGFSYYNGRQEVALNGAGAGVIRKMPPTLGPVLETRDDSPTQVCKRWAQQVAQLNGTLYIYGGQARTTEDQINNTWNNNFLTLDLTKSWDISSPALNGLPQPSGPPAVSLGYLWNDFNNLFLYGGQFSDKPYVDPVPISTWKYSIGSGTWTEYQSPRTSAGNSSEPGDQPVQRAAEGAGVSVPELGLSWYFGGHLDWATTPGWSRQTPRLYLKSLLEFTHPGYTNDGVYALADGTGSGEGGAYRNITLAGTQPQDSFPVRADGVLVFVPGWGDRGVLIGLAGGEVETFAENFDVLDVFDIARSEWYHQKTTGDIPEVRVNPCAVIASAPDASSFQIYMYGGQNLQPYAEQIQRNDMYILSIPAFTWIRVDQSGNLPPARAGHTCTLRDGQMIVFGGYQTGEPGCESPGIFVFNASSLEWSDRFTALDHPPDHHPENSVLANSFGYHVPDVVAGIIGGSPDGGATATTPSAGPATGGPFATGKPPVFTITASGATATVTQWGPGVTHPAGDPGYIPGPGAPSAGDNNNRQPGLVAAGVIAALAGLAAAYLGYCAWLYRRQVRAYKSHLAVANRYSVVGASGSSLGALAAFFGGGRKGSRRSNRDATAAAAGLSYSEKEKQPAARLSSDSSSMAGGGGGGVPAEGPWEDIPVEPRAFLDEDDPSPSSGSTGWPLRTSSGVASGSGTTPGSGSGTTPGTGSGSGAGGVVPGRLRRSASTSGGSTSSTERLLEGQEPSFFSVVMKPRRALRVVNGLEGGGEE